jgi:hypothetical protein
MLKYRLRGTGRDVLINNNSNGGRKDHWCPIRGDGDIGIL